MLQRRLSQRFFWSAIASKKNDTSSAYAVPTVLPFTGARMSHANWTAMSEHSVAVQWLGLN